MKTSSLLLTTCALALCACTGSTVKDTLGINRKAPDEFRVVSRPPLSVPPQFSLRPPSATDESPSAVPTDKQARELVTGTVLPTSGDNTFSLKSDTAALPVPASPADKKLLDGASAAEAQLLKNAGADKADPHVRDVLVEQRIVTEQREDPWWDPFGTSNKEKKDPLVNAKGESERIKANKQAGKPATEGDTPEIQDKDRGLLGRIFGR